MDSNKHIPYNISTIADPPDSTNSQSREGDNLNSSNFYGFINNYNNLPQIADIQTGRFSTNIIDYSDALTTIIKTFPL